MRRVALCIALCLAGAAPAIAAAVTVTLTASTSVATDSVTLAQVATISGPPGTVRLMEQATLVPRIAPGTSVRLTSAQVAAALAEAGFDLRVITLNGAPVVTVRRDRLPATPFVASTPGRSSAPMSAPPVSATPRVAAPPAGLETLVARGSTVQVVSAVGPIRVTTTGVALAAGAAGQVIGVRVLATRRDVAAIVIQRGVVAVVF